MRKRIWLWSPAPKEDHTSPAMEILLSTSLVIASSVKQEALTYRTGRKSNSKNPEYFRRCYVLWQTVCLCGQWVRLAGDLFQLGGGWFCNMSWPYLHGALWLHGTLARDLRVSPDWGWSLEICWRKLLLIEREAEESSQAWAHEDAVSSQEGPCLGWETRAVLQMRKPVTMEPGKRWAVVLSLFSLWSQGRCFTARQFKECSRLGFFSLPLSFLWFSSLA